MYSFTEKYTNRRGYEDDEIKDKERRINKRNEQ
jgi:hypothetical protein